MAELQFSLFPKQGIALRTKATEILFGGAAGGGKSHLIRVAAIYFAMAIPGLQIYFFRRTFPELSHNHMQGPSSFPIMLAPYLNEGLCKIVDMDIKFKNKSNIFLRHCQHEKNMVDWSGSEMHFIIFDELTTFTETIYRFLRSRARLGGFKVPKEFEGMFPRILGATNPGNIGHNWVKAMFVEPHAPFTKWRTDPKDGGMIRQFIPALLSDNKAMLVNDPKYVEKLQGLGNPALVKALLDGDWNIVSGGMFDDVWSPEKNIVQPFNIPISWRVYRSFDWGSSRPFSVGWWAESSGEEIVLADKTKKSYPKGSKFRIAEWYGWNGTPNEGLRMLASDIAKGILEKEKVMGLRVLAGPADTSIFDNENGNCIADDFARIGVKFERADKSPGSRIQGWQKLRSMMKAAHKFPLEDPGLFVFDTCRHFIRTIPTLPRDKRSPEDIDTDTEDHIADETRYALTGYVAPTMAVPYLGLRSNG